ncbi:hypothetical protein BDQ12DRAFT_376340 [Crucibulum laeve]|uniref:Uncharacterized protein n=1 Tax=Crucibulum laeve TaxID=68775 RepID=A0A5C3LMT2_9AGAR|nr:hypothetical protein BDQ12DRAFT_376340 [Crucibulum laeve]
MAVYAFLFTPHLILLIPHAALIAIILATYPYPTAPATDLLYSTSSELQTRHRLGEYTGNPDSLARSLMPNSSLNPTYVAAPSHPRTSPSHSLSATCTSTITIHPAHPHPPVHTSASPLPHLSPSFPCTPYACS